MDEQLKKLIGKEVEIAGPFFTAHGQLHQFKNVFGIAVFRGQRPIVQVAFVIDEIESVKEFAICLKGVGS